MPESQYKRYLGDGVYADYDGYHIVLTANVPTTDTIALDSHVVKALIKYLDQFTAHSEDE